MLGSFTMPDLVVDRNGAILLRDNTVIDHRDLMQAKSSDPDVLRGALQCRRPILLSIRLSSSLSHLYNSNRSFT